MITVRYTVVDDKISTLIVSGHAGYDVRGKDLVCAAVSGITFGLLNAADALLPSARCTVLDNRIEIRIDDPNERTELVMRTGLIQLKTVEESDPGFIKVKMEV